MRDLVFALATKKESGGKQERQRERGRELVVEVLGYYHNGGSNNRFCFVLYVGATDSVPQPGISFFLFFYYPHQRVWAVYHEAMKCTAL